MELGGSAILPACAGASMRATLASSCSRRIRRDGRGSGPCGSAELRSPSSQEPLPHALGCPRYTLAAPAQVLHSNTANAPARQSWQSAWAPPLGPRGASPNFRDLRFPVCTSSACLDPVRCTPARVGYNGAGFPPPARKNTACNALLEHSRIQRRLLHSSSSTPYSHDLTPSPHPHTLLSSPAGIRHTSILHQARLVYHWHTITCALWTRPPLVPAARAPLPQNIPSLSRHKPALSPIPDTALSALIPASGSGAQVLQSLGGPLDWFRRFILSMAGAVLLYNVNALCTIVAAFYWAWFPLWAAALSNLALRARYGYAAVWWARVLSAKLETDTQGLYKWRILIGDHTGTSIELLVDPPRHQPRLAFGDPALLVAVSDSPTFSRFKAVREAFFPRRGFWLGEERVLERAVFEGLRSQFAHPRMHGLSGEMSDDEDWDGLYSLLSDENTQAVRQYSFDEDMALPASTHTVMDEAAFTLFDRSESEGALGDESLGDVPYSSLLLDQGEAELCDRYRDL